MSGFDFNGDGNPLPEAVLGYALLSGSEAARRSAYLQQEQLNLLRAHQGLPPIELPRQFDYVSFMLSVMGYVTLAWVGFTIWMLKGPASFWFIGFVALIVWRISAAITRRLNR